MPVANAGDNTPLLTPKLARPALVESTLKVPEGPAAGAVFPARSPAVFAPIEIPSVPAPLILEIVTV